MGSSSFDQSIRTIKSKNPSRTSDRLDSSKYRIKKCDGPKRWLGNASQFASDPPFFTSSFQKRTFDSRASRRSNQLEPSTRVCIPAFGSLELFFSPLPPQYPPFSFDPCICG